MNREDGHPDKPQADENLDDPFFDGDYAEPIEGSDLKPTPVNKAADAGQEEDAFAEWDQPVDDFADTQNPENASLPEDEQNAEFENAASDQFDDLPEEGDLQQLSEDDNFEGNENTEYEGEYQSDDGEDMQAASEAPAQSNIMRYLPYGVGGAAILGLAFVAWSHLSSMMPSDNQTAQVFQTAPDYQDPQQVASLETNPNINTGSEQVQQPPAYQADPNNPYDAPPPQPASVNALPVLDGSQVPEPLAQMQAPISEDSVQPIMQPLVEADPQSVQAPAVNAPSSRVSELEDQLATMRATEDELRAKISNLEAQTSNAPAESTVKSLEQKLEELEQRLAEKNVAKASVEEPVASVPKKSRDYNRSSTKKSSRSARSSDSDAARLQREVNAKLRGGMVPRAGSTVSAIPSALPSGSAPRPSGWLLRSAQPGSAWLSLGGSNNLRRVSMGENVQGLGTIIAIRQVAGRWVVEGTTGSVR